MFFLPNFDPAILRWLVWFSVVKQFPISVKDREDQLADLWADKYIPPINNLVGRPYPSERCNAHEVAIVGNCGCKSPFSCNTYGNNAPLNHKKSCNELAAAWGITVTGKATPSWSGLYDPHVLAFISHHTVIENCLLYPTLRLNVATNKNLPLAVQHIISTYLFTVEAAALVLIPTRVGFFLNLSLGLQLGGMAKYNVNR